jgi:hypothetical protein
MSEIKTFNNYKLFEQFCLEQTGSRPSEPGISLTLRNKTAILRSNDGTAHYPDDLSDINNPKYTLFGPSGDQSITGRFNATLLNESKIDHVFLYRVIKKKSKKQYLWYGKYQIGEKISNNHVGLDGQMRKVILLQLKRIQMPIEELVASEEFVINVKGGVDFDNDSSDEEEGDLQTMPLDPDWTEEDEEDSQKHPKVPINSGEDFFTALIRSDYPNQWTEEDEEEWQRTHPKCPDANPDLQKILDVCSKINSEMTELNNSLKKKLVVLYLNMNCEL